MLANYLKIAVRNLMRNRLFSFINIFGMAIGLTSALLIGIFVFDEWAFDRYHPDGDRTFRIYNVVSHDQGGGGYYPIVPYPFASFMQKDFPEIESTLRIMDTYVGLLVEANGKKIMEAGGIYAEPTVFDMLTIHVVSGNPQESLAKPQTIAISSTMARKYFGNANPIGETMNVNHEGYQVTAVFEDTPPHLHLNPTFMLSFASTGWATRFENNWQRQQLITYLKLKPGTNAAALEAKFKPFVEKYAYPSILPLGLRYLPHLQNIRDIHLHSSNFEWDIASHGNALAVYALAGTGTIILVIAILNFVNLSTARALRRIKEVGVRKVIGAQRKQLILQFTVESTCITLAGFLLSSLMSELALPLLNEFAEKQLVLPFAPLPGSLVVLSCVFLGVIAGSYPAFYLSAFRPANALSNKATNNPSNAFFRQGLVTLQFMFSFFLIISAIVVASQHGLLMNKDLGFNKDQLVLIPLRSAQLAHFEATKREFANHANVVSATVAYGIPGDISAGDEVIDPVTHKVLPTTLYCVDYDYLITMGMHLIAGRDFSRAFPSDDQKAFILNETAVREFGFGSPEQAVGHRLDWHRWDADSLKKGVIIGVVKDFHFKSLREKLSPVVMQVFPPGYWKIALRIKPGDVPATIDFLKRTYERLDPEWSFTYQFADRNFDRMYKSEAKLSGLFSIFTILAITVACMGLFGLVEYSVNQRTKEISIRKVFGASVASLLLLLTRRYFLLVLISFTLIIPFSYFAAEEWLSHFAYHITLTPGMYFKAAGFILMITVITISFQSIRAAWANPAQALHSE